MNNFPSSQANRSLREEQAFVFDPVANLVSKRQDLYAKSDVVAKR